MALASKKRTKIAYLTIIARVLFLILGTFILKAYFFAISGKFYFTSSDELMHFTGFAIFGLIFAIAFPKFNASLGITFITLFGIMLEIAQPLLTADRQLSVSDMIANGLGGLIGNGLGALIIGFTSKHSP